MSLTRWILCVVLAFPLVGLVRVKAAEFPPISPEELKMTNLPEQPGAPAVVLMREEVDDDMNNMQAVH